MAKKFKFTDLAYDDAKLNLENKKEKNENYLQDLKNNIQSQKEDVSTNFSKKTEIPIEEKENFNFEITQSNDSLNNNEVKKIKKINYEVDYSEYDDGVDNKLNSNNSSRSNDMNLEKNHYETNEKRTQLRTYSSVLDEKDLNRTNNYNEMSHNQENLSSTMGSTFSPNKIKDLISFKEKLDVKTNIYLKSSIVVKLKELEKRTNESRSSIINKLLEFAIKNMEEK